MPPQQRYPTSAGTSYTFDGVKVVELDSFPTDVNLFPTGCQILGRYLCLVRRESSGSITRRLAVEKVAEEVKEIWEGKGNVPSRSVRSIGIQIDNLVSTYQAVRRHEKDEKRRKTEGYLKKKVGLVAELKKVMDVKEKDHKIADAEKASGIPYGVEEKALYEDQISQTFQLTVGEVDQEWLAEQKAREEREERKKEREEKERKRKERSDAEMSYLFSQNG